jgi:putative heme-binding domain-containing protein
MKTSLIRGLPALLVLTAALRAAPEALFDGKSLAGWDGDPKWWRVQDGCLTGGSLTEKVPRNFFLTHARSFQNFDLRLRIKLTGVPGTGMINSGVQIRSLRVPNDTEMAGYQVDAGEGWWGKLYDESRRRRVIAEPADTAAVNAAVRKDDWNEYRIRAEGPRIRSWINGVPALDFTETEPRTAADGLIGVQIHSGGMALVQVKDVVIEELPPTPGAVTWAQVGLPPPPPPKEKNAKKKSASATPAAPAPVPAAKTAAAPKTGRDISYNAMGTDPLSPERQRASFRVPEGFEVELVAAESPGLGKFIGLSWDARMRLWSMTALEYPVDANENKAESDALFARGGRDRVVVFDDPHAASPGPPRVFADGLVMPLGVQPWRDGALVQYGTDIRFYRDTDGDGRADRHEVVLTGFGTQDSHLFPHQFLRQPGGWVFVAQGLFNYSKVRRPDGRPFANGTAEVPFVQCKLARFRPDGSAFENLTAGPNNIWGLVTSREGETYLQEANDQGYPVIPYAPGIWVRTGSKDLLRPYQPLMPAPLAPAQMVGTGLSGLALAEDSDGRFRATAGATTPGTKVFYLANPITGAIQIVTAAPDGPRFRYAKQADFLTTDDRWFRPIAIAFGPDGALYIVDWYNRIISHNEVPRTHPDRDKSRGRIWRVRHRDQPRTAPPDLTRLADQELLAQLGHPNALVSRLAWLEITDRRAIGLAPDLTRLAADRQTPVDRRLAALWALEGLRDPDPALLAALAADPDPAPRREAARLAAMGGEDVFLRIAGPLANDPHPAVRAALGDALRRLAGAGPRAMHVAARLGAGRLGTEAGEWERYERDFERYLARWAMEENPAATRSLLDSPPGRDLPVENRVLATLALGGRDAATGLARLSGALGRALNEEEIRVLAAHFGDPAVRTVLASALTGETTRAPVLRAFLSIRTGIDAAPLSADLAAAAGKLLSSPQASEVILGADVAGAFRLKQLAAPLERLVEKEAGATPASLAALRALREMGEGLAGTFEAILRKGAATPITDELLAALAGTRDPAGPVTLVRLLPDLGVGARGRALDQLSRSPAGAAAVAAQLKTGRIPAGDIGPVTLERLRLLRPDDGDLAALAARLGAEGLNVLRLGGADADYAATRLTLKGAFTVEAWFKLEAPISNHDGLLAAPGRFDLNFAGGQPRLWLGSELRDVVVARRKITPGVWTHGALTRDADGVFRIYVNGELDATGTRTDTSDYSGLDLGRTSPRTGGTAGWIAEFRVWREARSASEIRASFDRTHANDPARPAGLVQVFAGADWGRLQGAARIEHVTDAPALLTPAEAAAQEEKFKRYRALANTRGNAEHGRALFTTTCLACHQQGGKGGQVGPALDGVGLTGVEPLLRNLLTPSAAMESAYRTYRVVTRDGAVHEGFLAEDRADAVVLRVPGSPDRAVPRDAIREAAYLRRSLMPEGLLEAMPPEHVSDLFAHLKSLR